MDATGLLLIVMRWLHAAASTVWVGAILVELLAIAGRDRAGAEDRPILSDSVLRDIVQTALLVFLISGAILTFDRLSHGAAKSSYVAVLALKLIVSVAMFQVSFRFRSARHRRRVLGLRIIAGLGLLILFLASLLKSIYERALLS